MIYALDDRLYGLVTANSIFASRASPPPSGVSQLCAIRARARHYWPHHTAARVSATFPFPHYFSRAQCFDTQDIFKRENNIKYRQAMMTDCDGSSFHITYHYADDDDRFISRHAL